MRIDVFRRNWHRTLERLGIVWAGPPHSICHIKPTVELATGEKTCEKAGVRGRRARPESVERYTKSHWLTRHLAALPDTVHLAGVEFWAAPAEAGIDTTNAARADERHLT